MNRIGNQVIFPVVSRQASLPRSSLRQKIIQKRKLILFVAAPLLAILVCFGDVFTSVLYDERYQDAAWMLPILALGIWPNLLTITMSPSLLAIGKPLYEAGGNFFKFCYMAIGLPIGFSLFGVIGAVIVVALNDLPFYAAVSYGLWREKLTAISQDIQATALLLGLVTLLLFGRHLCGFGLNLPGNL